MKRFVFLSVLAVTLASGVFAQEIGSKNWLSADLSFMGAGVRYERVLNDRLSVGGTAYWDTSFFSDSYGINLTARYYPWSGRFYGELGLGYGVTSGFQSDRTIDFFSFYTITGAMISPSIGWKIDVGKLDGFYINPFINIPMVLGTDIDNEHNSQFKFGFSSRFAVGMGYSF